MVAEESVSRSVAARKSRICSSIQTYLEHKALVWILVVIRCDSGLLRLRLPVEEGMLKRWCTIRRDCRAPIVTLA